MKSHHLKPQNLLALVTLAACATLFGACNMKSCFCCEAAGNTAVEVETYTESTSSCASLSNKTRTCLEYNERIDCSMVAIGYKK